MSPDSELVVSVRAQIDDLSVDLQTDYAFAEVFIAHDLAVFWPIADRGAVMTFGRNMKNS